MIMKKINLIGKKFGKLTVISKSQKTDKNNNQYWICKCDCGNIKEIRGTHLQVTNSRCSTKSCGCLKKSLILPLGESAFTSLYYMYKKNAKARNLRFNLTKKQFKDLTKQNCFYCGREPSQKIHPQRTNGYYVYNGIDRLNNKKGYTTENCVSCCGICNTMKWNMSFNQFYRHIEKVYKTITTVD